MSETEYPKQESTSVEEVRRVREKIAAQHRGDFRRHREETNRIFEELRERLHLKLSPPAKDRVMRSGT